MKELKDYLHLYLFADFMAIPQHSMNREYEQCRIKGLLTRGTEIEMVGVDGVPFFSFIPDIKPILRPLSDMTEDDCPKWFKEWMPDGFDVFHQISGNFHCIEIDSKADDGYCLTIHDDGSMHCECKDNGEQYGYKGGELFRHLLSKHFDLFGLIEAGLAINKTKI